MVSVGLCPSGRGVESSVCRIRGDLVTDQWPNGGGQSKNEAEKTREVIRARDILHNHIGGL